MSRGAGWDKWGNEAHGIPIPGTGMAAGTTVLLPAVRDPTPEEIRGIKTGTRPDLVEAIRKYERILIAYNADLRAQAKTQAEDRAARSEKWWARRIAKHPELAAEREHKQTLRQRRTARDAAYFSRKAAKELAEHGTPWWEIVADPTLYEAALRGEYKGPAQPRLPLAAEVAP